MTSKRTSSSRTSSATPAAALEEQSNSSSSADSISVVVPKGDHRASLLAIRDRLAAETDDLTWSKHKNECHCVCGIGDPRSLVALTKRLEETLTAISALPQPERKESAVDRARAAATKRQDELAERRSHRAAGGSAS
jgi:hypothetical protein